MLYLTCTTITSADLAHYGISRAKDWVSVDCGTILERILRQFYIREASKNRSQFYCSSVIQYNITMCFVVPF